jgi:20S proteasome alpha/beta subunit
MQCRLKPPRVPPPKRLGERKRMTIALGILASDGVVLAADTQETAGYFKGFALKIHSAMTQTNPHSTVQSAVAVTGSGPGVYLDAIADEIIRDFHRNQDSSVVAFESHLRERVEDFWARHVANKPDHSARAFDLIIGVQIEGHHSALWLTEGSVVKPSTGFESVGTGSPYARMAIQYRAVNMDVQSAAILAILGVAQAKEHDTDCGKNTTVTFLKNNLAYTMRPYQVEEAEKLFNRYAGIEYSAFVYALGNESLDDAEWPSKLIEGLRQLRGEFSQLAAQLSNSRD